MAGQKDFLGRGWKFPIQLDAVSGRVAESAYEQSISDSLKIILQTQPGERVMRPDFGCRLKDFAFQEPCALISTVLPSLLVWLALHFRFWLFRVA